MLIPLREALNKVGWHKFPKRWQDTIIDSESHRSGLDLVYDPVPDYGAALRRVLSVRGLKGPSDTDVRLNIANGAELMVRRAFKREQEKKEREKKEREKKEREKKERESRATQPDTEERETEEREVKATESDTKEREIEELGIKATLAAFLLEFRDNLSVRSRPSPSAQRYKMLAEAKELLATFVQQSNEAVAFLDEAGHGRQPINPGLWETPESPLVLNYQSSLGQYEGGGLLSNGGEVWLDEGRLDEYLEHVDVETLPREEYKVATLTRHHSWFTEANNIVDSKSCPRHRDGKPNKSWIARMIRTKLKYAGEWSTIRDALSRHPDFWDSDG